MCGFARIKTTPAGFYQNSWLLRGIASLEIKSWSGAHFDRLIRRCFTARTKPWPAALIQTDKLGPKRFGRLLIRAQIL